MAVKKKTPAAKKPAAKKSSGKKTGVLSKVGSVNAPTQKKAPAKKTTTKKPSTKKAPAKKLSPSEQKKRNARNKVTADRRKKGAAKTIKQRLADRVKKHGDGLKNAAANHAKKKALVVKRQKVALGNFQKKQKAALTNLERAYKARIGVMKKKKPVIKDGKIVVPKVPKATYKKVTPKLAKMPSLRTTKGATKKRSGGSAAAKKAAKTRKTTAKKATKEA